MVRMSERGRHIVGSPDENNMDQGEAYERTKNRSHCEIIAQDELQSFQLPQQQPKDNQADCHPGKHPKNDDGGIHGF
jgi:hypothetical protein